LTVDAQRMMENLERSGGAVFSQPVLLALVERGMSRDSAYRLVQGAATRGASEGRGLRAVLAEDPEVKAILGEDLEACFDLGKALARAGRAVDALDRAEAP
ncbi:MAG: adenylosuccinate lyase, partial [Acidimicrobiia bacterium]